MLLTDYVSESVGSTAPYDEKVAQAPYGDKHDEALNEADRFVAMLKGRFINLPDGLSIRRAWNPYDTFGYYDVQVRYDSMDDSHNRAFIFIESNMPSRWSDLEVYDVSQEKQVNANVQRGCFPDPSPATLFVTSIQSFTIKVYTDKHMLDSDAQWTWEVVDSNDRICDIGCNIDHEGDCWIAAINAVNSLLNAQQEDNRSTKLS